MSGSWTNDGVTTLTIPTGATSGQRVVIANPATGDAVDVYNSANQLIYSIDQFGVATAFNHALSWMPTAIAEGGIFALGDNQGNQGQLFMLPSHAPALPASLTVLMGPAVGNTGFLQIFGASPDGTSQPTVEGNERNVSGSILQSDQVSTNNLVHTDTYTITTDAAATSTFNHGAGFTPRAGFLMGVNGVGATFAWQSAWFPNPFTSTTAHAAFVNNVGTTAGVASTTIGAYGVFLG